MSHDTDAAAPEAVTAHYADGSRSGDFDRGRQVGTWRTLDRAGRLVKETNFSKG
jgi:hypothetical protein